MQPTLPIFKVPPERQLFYFLELFPNVVFCALLILMELVGVVLLMTFFLINKCQCRPVFWAFKYTGKLATLVFPSLFSEKKIQVTSHDDSKEILHG